MIAERVQERLAGFSRRELIGLAVLAVLIVAGAGFWYVRSLPRPVAISMGSDGQGSAAMAPATSPSPSPRVIVVDVAGWVRHPGVYEFQEGDRVVDAIQRAGGARPKADLTSINLAALLTDGQQIVVYKRGGGGAAGAISGSGSGSGATGPINLNTATLDQLETLPGIGPALGQRIIDYREQHGPFRSVDELLNVSGIGEKRLADLRASVTV